MHPRILVVEAHADLRSVIAEALTRADYGCDAVGNASDAMLKLREGSYSSILVDVDSPTSITALCAAIASDPSLLSRLVLISDADVYVDLPQQKLLQKPFDTRGLLNLVHH